MVDGAAACARLRAAPRGRRAGCCALALSCRADLLPPPLPPPSSQVGSFGIVHPEVLEAFEIPFPVSALELNLDPFCFDQFYKSLM
jgi:hypothetical protein